uniref:MutS-related protein n=1 Tax=Halorientalis sp. TaxID=1931229 RepID=UPI0039C89A68
LAQAGSFVPAADARLSLVDRVFTRVGASDDIAGGKSTFMVEMTELAEILENATDRSLILLDEVGRGTSTTDGLAIARAVTEYVHDEIGARTLFATHHHELTDAADALDGVCNLHFRAEQNGQSVRFDHQIREGPAAASYGVEVAREAGVPDSVVDRSRELLDADETNGAQDGKRATNGHHPDTGANGDESTAGSSADGPDADLAATIRAQNLATTTPMDALALLQELQEQIEDG